MNSPQPDGLAMRMPCSATKLAVDRALGVVLGALVGRELDDDALGLVLGEVVARELDDVLAVDDGADERAELGVAAVGALGRRREPEAKRREARARGQRVGRAGQVMALVEDDEPEARAEVLHVQVRRVVGGDGERLHVVLAAADEADGRAEGRASRSYHWRTRSSVGATTSVLRRLSSIARSATWLLPAPVGSTTTPRPRCARHAASASVW